MTTNSTGWAKGRLSIHLINPIRSWNIHRFSR